MGHVLRQVPTVLVLGLASGVQAAGTSGLPSPGSYRVDTESTQTSTAGPTQVTVVQRTDGATGRQTVTQSSSVNPSHVVTHVVAGTGPDIRCFAYNAPPPMPGAPVCRDLKHGVGPSGATQQGVCHGVGLDERWSRLDDGTWQRSLRVTGPPPSAPGSPQAAIDMAAWGMSPAERARLMARLQNELPSDAQRAQAIAELRAKAEALARGGNAQEAAMARQALAVMDGGAAAPGGGVVHVVNERWTRVGEACAAKR
jgi:hypothetical protein